MICKLKKGNGFRGLLNYAMQKEGGELIGGNMAGQNPRALAREFGITRGLNTRCKQPVFHASLSLADGEHLTDDQWHQAAEDFLEKMGFARDQHQFAVIRHTDAAHDHVHIIANRVNLQTLKAVDLEFDYRRGHQACRQLEQTFGLTPGTAKGKQRQIEVATGGKADAMRAKVDEAIKQSKGDRDLFKGILSRAGIKLSENKQSTGRIAGVTYVDSAGGAALKGSELGKGYSAVGLERRLAAARQHAQAAAPSFAGSLQREAGAQIANAVASAVPGLGSVLKATKAVQKLTNAAAPRPTKSKSHDHEM